MTGRVMPVFHVRNFKNWVLTGHKTVLVNCFFEENSLNVYFQKILIYMNVYLHLLFVLETM